MPITCSHEILPIEQSDFQAVDHTVTGLAFSVQNSFGRLLNEVIYSNELTQRCESAGFAAAREVELKVAHRDFSKSYFIDLLINNSIIYELKVTSELNLKHHSQLLNYLLLSGLNHGKLFNFRPRLVETRFVSTRLNPADRKRFSVCACSWKCASSEQDLPQLIHSLMEDWGTFLSVDLYRDAVIHFLGGTEKCVVPVEIRADGKSMGSQPMILSSPSSMVHITAMKSSIKTYASNLYRLLRLTNLSSVHWINFRQNSVTIQTIHR